MCLLAIPPRFLNNMEEPSNHTLLMSPPIHPKIPKCMVPKATMVVISYIRQSTPLASTTWHHYPILSDLQKKYCEDWKQPTLISYQSGFLIKVSVDKLFRNMVLM